MKFLAYLILFIIMAAWFITNFGFVGCVLAGLAVIAIGCIGSAFD